MVTKHSSSTAGCAEWWRSQMQRCTSVQSITQRRAAVVSQTVHESQFFTNFKTHQFDNRSSVSIIIISVSVRKNTNPRFRIGGCGFRGTSRRRHLHHLLSGNDDGAALRTPCRLSALRSGRSGRSCCCQATARCSRCDKDAARRSHDGGEVAAM